MMANRLQISCCTGLILFSVLLVNNLVQSSVDDDDDLPFTKLSQNVGGPTLRFLYCYSCGYRKAFEEYVNIIQPKYPDIIIDGQNFDPPGINMLIARLVGILKMLVIMCILGGVNVFNYINQAQPSWWTWCVENKLYACLMIFFLCNLIEGQLMQSGAFEIILNDVPVWSKLETGRIPQPAELFQIIDNHMKFTKLDLNTKNFAK